MGRFTKYLNPVALRSRITGKPMPANSDDSGAMIVEAMVYVGIFAIIAAAIGPKMIVFIEKASVSNVQGDAQTVAQTIEANYSLEGEVQYKQADLVKSAEGVRVNKGTQVAVQVLDENGNSAASGVGTGYRIFVKSEQTKHYCIVYTTIMTDDYRKQLNNLPATRCDAGGTFFTPVDNNGSVE